MNQASHGATVLLYSPGIDPFLEDITKEADRMFYFEKGPRETPQADCQDMAENEGSKDFRGILMKLV